MFQFVLVRPLFVFTVPRPQLSPLFKLPQASHRRVATGKFRIMIPYYSVSIKKKTIDLYPHVFSHSLIQILIVFFFFIKTPSGFWDELRGVSPLSGYACHSPLLAADPGAPAAMRQCAEVRPELVYTVPRPQGSP